MSKVKNTILCLYRSAIFFLTVFCLVLHSPSLSAHGMAQGEPAEVRISTAEDFLALAKDCQLDAYSKGLSVLLTADIDFEGYDFVPVPLFGGVFDGGGHTLSGISAEVSDSSMGIFRYLQRDAVLKNLHVKAELTSAAGGTCAGGIVGTNAGLVTDCTFTGSVHGTDTVGGIAGSCQVFGIIENCTAEGNISGSHFVGGIAGENRGVIRSCKNLSHVNTAAAENNVSLEDITAQDLIHTEDAAASTDIGGIAGTNTGVLRDCKNLGPVGYQSMGYNIGGIAGSQNGYIVDCHNEGEIFARREAGGIAGQLEPVNVLEYSEDTLQILRGQLATLQKLSNRASSHAKSANDQMQTQLDTLHEQASLATNALDGILGQLNIHDGTLPDRDVLTASRNDLTNQLNGMVGSMDELGKTYSNASGLLISDLESVSRQIDQISGTILNAQENLGFTATDISDLDTEEDTESKIASCVNRGRVNADENGGGIAGVIAMETDLDIGEDIENIGRFSVNASFSYRSVIRGCSNEADICVKKRQAGGIVGSMDAGAVLDCSNLGAVNAEDADETGGIAGVSRAVIRRCYVKSTVSGESYVGGIAGLGSTVTDARALVRILSDGPKVGAILGDASTSLFLQSTLSKEEQTVTDNYYLVSGRDPGGADGISYFGCAQPLSTEEFLSLEGLPDLFRTVTLHFAYADGTVRDIPLATGQSFSLSSLPQVPDREGFDGSWDGVEEADFSRVLFDETFNAVYTPYRTVLEARIAGWDGPAKVLAEGSFPADASFELSASEESPDLSEDLSLSEKQRETSAVLESFAVFLDTDAVLRYLPPKEAGTEDIAIYTADQNGQWFRCPYSVDGSYLVFDFPSGKKLFCAVEVPEDGPAPVIFAAAAGILLFLAFFSALLLRRRKRKLNAPSVQDNKSPDTGQGKP